MRQIMFITKKKLWELIEKERADAYVQGYGDGVTRGYGCGKIAGEAEARNLGYILGGQVNQILNKEGF